MSIPGPFMDWERRNNRRLQLEGLRNRIDRATLWSQLRFLYTALFEVWEQVS